MSEDNKRFGYIAVEMGFIAREQLLEATEIQISEELESYKHRYIGQILLDLNYMTMTQVDKVLEVMWL